MAKIATVKFNSQQLLQNPIPAELMERIFRGMPHGSRIVGMRDGVDYYGAYASYLLIMNDSFIETPDGAVLEAYPQIEITFQRDSIGNINISEINFEKAMGLKIPKPPGFIPTAVPAAVPAYCYPTWKKYDSLLPGNSFNYCTKCGKKEGEHQ